MLISSDHETLKKGWIALRTCECWLPLQQWLAHSRGPMGAACRWWLHSSPCTGVPQRFGLSHSDWTPCTCRCHCPQGRCRRGLERWSRSRVEPWSGDLRKWEKKQVVWCVIMTNSQLALQFYNRLVCQSHHPTKVSRFCRLFYPKELLNW